MPDQLAPRKTQLNGTTGPQRMLHDLVCYGDQRTEVIRDVCDSRNDIPSDSAQRDPVPNSVTLQFHGALQYGVNESPFRGWVITA